MANTAVSQALTRLGDSLSIVGTAANAAIDARLTPDPTDLNLADYALGGLAEPIPAPIDLTAVIKNVDFGTPTVTDATGDATPLPNAPGLGTGEQLTTPFSAINGLLVRLSGTIGIPVDVGHVAVSIDVCWTATVDVGSCPGMMLIDPGRGTVPEVAPDDIPDLLPCAIDPDRGVFGVRTNEPRVSIPVVPPLVPMRASEIGKTCAYQLRATVRLRALGESVDIDLGPIPIPVPAVPIPTVLGVFSEVGYSLSKDGAKMFIVPTDVPVDAGAAIDALRDVQQILARVQTIDRVAGFLTGLGLLVNAVKPPIDTRHRLLFKQLTQARDLGDVAPDWRHRGWWDDHGAEDDIDSMILISVDQQLELFEDHDFEDTKVTARPSGTLFFVAVPDFHKMDEFEPADATVAGASDFSDQAHSLRFVPR